MNIALSYKNVEVRRPVETEVARYVGKLGKLLKSYSPDLVQLHGAIEKRARTSAFTFSLNLSLPTGTLHATSEEPDVQLSVKHAFAELETQVKKHQAKLRKDYQWKKKRRALPAV